MKNFLGNAKLLIGIVISIFFMYLAFREVKFHKMAEAFTEVNYWYVMPALALLFFSHWLRAIRWHYLMSPIRKVEISPLFSALMIGYMANIFLPAHLGEFLRAYVLGKKRQVPAGAVFGTIVIERIIDVFTLLLLMALTFIVFPFPELVRKSGYVTFVGAAGLLLALILMKRYRETSLRWLTKILKPFPKKLSSKIDKLFHSFLDGVVGLENWRHYVIMVILSLIIWACYGAIFHVLFIAFDFVTIYSLSWTTGLVVLVITTISVLVPSSPGYVGTYHYLCQLALGMFGIPQSDGLTFAFVAHGINFFPILLVGLIFAGSEGISISKVSKQAHVETAST
jgi:uncharacterized protein (TIRG00374 family)